MPLVLMLSVGSTGCQLNSPTAVPLEAAAPAPDAMAEAIASIDAQVQRQTPAADAIPTSLYRLDSQCQDYIVEPALVDPEQPITDIVGQILLSQAIIAFDLSGYRVSRSPDGATVTIDLRLAYDSQRRLASLAECEKQALFGSIRQTLMQPEWNISQVRFTNRGEPLLL